MKKNICIGVVALLAFISGCQRPYELELDFALNREELRFTKAESRSYFFVYSKTSWTLEFEKPVEWVSLSRMEGVGNQQVDVVCEANNGVSRSVRIIVTNQDGSTKSLTLSQETSIQEPKYTISKTSVRMLSEGTLLMLPATTNLPESLFADVTCEVRSSVQEDWISDIEVTPEGVSCNVSDFNGEGSREATVVISFPPEEMDNSNCVALFKVVQVDEVPEVLLEEEYDADPEGAQVSVSLKFNWDSSIYQYDVSPMFEADWIIESCYDEATQSIIFKSEKNEALELRNTKLTCAVIGPDGNTLSSSTAIVYQNFSNEISISDAVSMAKPLYDGSEYANCYLLENKQSAVYSFDINKVDGSKPEGIVSASLLWQNASEPVGWVGYKDEKVYFQLYRGRTGNAVLCARNAEKEICWSWHIWVVDSPVGTNSFNGVVFMDRNLGSYGNDFYTRTGTYYQWGRKDPFPGASAGSGNVKPAEVSPKDSVSVCVAQDGKDASWVDQHPSTYIVGEKNEGKQDWRAKQDNNLWLSSSGKKNNDPCPYGYKVPKYDTDFGSSGLTNLLASSEAVDGIMVVNDDDNKDAEFYLGGRWQRTKSDNMINNMKNEGWLWACNGTGTLDKSHFGSTTISGVAGGRKLNFKTRSAVYNGNGVPRRWGANVRCVKIN